MARLLQRLFIKDYQNVSDPRVRTRYGLFCAIFGICLNVILVGLKLGCAIALAAKANWVFSMALLGESVNNLGDIASSVVSLLGFKFAAKPADKEHPYGHQRIEYVSALIVSFIILVAAGELVITSASNAINGVLASYDALTLIVLGVGIVLKAFQSYINYSFGKAIDSVALRATGQDSLMDAIATSTVLVSAALSFAFGWNFIDAYLGIAVGLFILYSGFSQAKEAVDLLIGKALPKGFEEEIEAAAKIPGVIGVHDIRCHYYGPTKLFLSLHIEVEASQTLAAAHSLADEIERRLGADFHAEVTVHVDPYEGENANKETVDLILKTLQKLDERISLHDFHKDEETLSFDVVLPHGDKKIGEAEMLQLLNPLFPDAKIRITIDRPYEE